MRKVKVYKCPVCKKPYMTLGTWGSHMETVHPENIPKGYSISRYFYYILTGKTHGNCIQCKDPTEWNEITQKYDRYCKKIRCKEEYKAIASNRIIGKYGKMKSLTITADGKAHLLSNPDQQRKMLANRKNSGTYKFQDGGEVNYFGSYEKDFLIMLDTFLNLPSDDLMMPSPHTYYYVYKNQNDKEHEGIKFYIPDAYIPSLNLEIEIKENTNMHPKILAIDKVKEKAKDELMHSNKEINYIKLVEKDYSDFFEFFLNLKSEIPDEDLPSTNINTSISTESTNNTNEFFSAIENTTLVICNENSLGNVSYLQPLEKNFKKNNHIDLSLLNKVELNEDNLKDIKEKYKDFKWRFKFSIRKDFKEIFWYNNNEMVAMVGIDFANNDGIKLEDLLINQKYQGSGLGRQILEYVVKTYNIKYVDTFETSEVAYRMYKNYGFKEVKRENGVIYMKLE